jgi:hypothetical protein
MKKKIKKLIEFKKRELLEVVKLQKTEKKSFVLNDLYKNENEIKAQLQILRFLLPE